MRVIVSLILLLATSCGSFEQRPRCRGQQWSIPADSLQKRVDDVDGEFRSFLRSLGLETLPAEARLAVERDFAARFAELAAAKRQGADVWSFRYEKCPDCGWYRAGYIALRDCRVVHEVETKDDM